MALPNHCFDQVTACSRTLAKLALNVGRWTFSPSPTDQLCLDERIKSAPFFPQNLS